MIKRRFFYVFLFLLLHQYIMQAQQTIIKETNPIQSKAKRFLGSSAIIIMEAEQVTAYLLDANKHTGQIFEGFTIIKKGKPLTLNNIEEIKRILSTDATYGFDNFRKNCTFTPILGIEFKKKGKTVRILVSFDCNVWRFIGDNINKEEDFDPARSIMLDYYKKLFENQQ